MKPVIQYHLPLVVYGLAILAVSSIPNLQTPQSDSWPVDKAAHMVEYAGLALLTYRSSLRWPGLPRPEAALWIAGLVPVGWGLLDEWLQSHIEGRFSDRLDFVADVAGATLAVAIIWFTRHLERSRGT